jgi:hypothetical protein
MMMVPVQEQIAVQGTAPATAVGGSQGREALINAGDRAGSSFY